MSSPTLPNDLKNAIPRSGQSLCAKLVPSITLFMQKYYDFYAWMFDANGNLSTSFKQDICALECFSGGGGGTTTCPEVTVTVTVTPGNTENVLTIAGAGMTEGYDYNIYRSTTDGGPWGSAIETDVTTGSNISFTDTGRTNTTEYFYKVTVQKSGCPVYTGYGSGTPSACKTLNLAIEATVPLATGVVQLKVTETAGKLYNEVEVQIWRSTTSAEQGDSIFDGTIADHPCVDNLGRVAFCYNDSSLTGGVTYYYTVKVSEGGACTLYTLQASGKARSAPLAAPHLTGLGYNNSTGVHWTAVTGAVGYKIYRSAHGDLANYDFIPFTVLQSTVFDLYFNLSQWPCTMSGSLSGGGEGGGGQGGTPCHGLYGIYVTAVAADGTESPPSNAVQIAIAGRNR